MSVWIETEFEVEFMFEFCVRVWILGFIGFECGFKFCADFELEF